MFGREGPSRIVMAKTHLIRMRPSALLASRAVTVSRLWETSLYEVDEQPKKIFLLGRGLIQVYWAIPEMLIWPNHTPLYRNVQR